MGPAQRSGWLRRLALGTALGLACAGSRAATVAPEAAGITYDRLARLVGVTFCRRGEPVSYIRAGLSPVERAAAEAHEAVHRAQYARARGCTFDSAYRSPRVQLEAEAEAYAAGWCAAVRAGGDSVALEIGYLERLAGLGVMAPPWDARETARAAWGRYARRCR